MGTRILIRSTPVIAEPHPEFAAQWLAQRRLANARLEQLRLEELRSLTEREAARIFSLLDPPRPYRLRPTSGLVEQQRRFRLIRERRAAQADNSEAGP